MPAIIVYIIACFSTAAFLSLWFWVVRKELRIKKSMVESAELQLIACRKNCLRAEDGLEKAALQSIVSRSEDIYRQSVKLYDQMLAKPWIYVPGRLLGFQKIKVKQ